MNDIYTICPVCKSVVAVPDADRVYNCIGCEAKPPLLHTTDLFKACGEIKEGMPGAKLKELMVLLQSAIDKELNKDNMKDGPIHNL
jgi:hypothetical protein